MLDVVWQIAGFRRNVDEAWAQTAINLFDLIVAQNGVDVRAEFLSFSKKMDRRTVKCHNFNANSGFSEGLLLQPRAELVEKARSCLTYTFMTLPNVHFSEHPKINIYDMHY